MNGRLYARTFSLTFFFAVSMIVAGLLIVTIPEVRVQSPTITVLPQWVAIAFGLTEFLGGAATCYGIWRFSPRFEAAGLVLLAAAQFVALGASIAAIGLVASASGIVLRGGLGLGCALRAYLLAVMK